LVLAKEALLVVVVVVAAVVIVIVIVVLVVVVVVVAAVAVVVRSTVFFRRACLAGSKILLASWCACFLKVCDCLSISRFLSFCLLVCCFILKPRRSLWRDAVSCQCLQSA
jgi:hypothetical protein